MTFNPSSPVSGAAISGLTTPTFTLTQDTAPGSNGKQFAVTALGGTQTGVDTHSVSKPFTHTFFRPQQLKVLPAPSNASGVVKNIPVNTYKLVSRKGAVPAANNSPRIPVMTTTFDIPAGCEAYEPEEIKAMLSAHVGLLVQQLDGIFSTITTGIA